MCVHRPPAGEEYLRLLNSMVAASAEARALGADRRGRAAQLQRRSGFRLASTSTVPSPPRWRQGQASLC